MSQQRTCCYEGLFLFPQAATADLGGAVEHVRDLLIRIDAEVLSLSKWEERRLAYDIRGNKRGLYLLAYFKAGTESIAALERSCSLSEQLLRTMFIRADHLTEDEMRRTDAQQALKDEVNLRQSDATGEEAESGDSEEELAEAPTTG